MGNRTEMGEENTAPLPAQASSLWQPRHNPWFVAISVILPTFMEVLDTTIVTVSLNHMAGSLSSTSEEATWVVTSYLISNAIILPASGWLSSIFGRKRFLMTCVTIFTVSSFFCGFATSLPMLIAARVVQGAGGGALQPLSQAILLESFPPRKRGMAMAAFGLGVVIAPILGPTLGGWITENYTWPWVFYINLPVGTLALLLVSRFVEDPPYIRAARPQTIDGIGFGLMAVWLGSLQILLDKGQQEDWFASEWITGLFVLSSLAMAVFIVWELWGTNHPIVDLRVLRNRNFAVGTILVGAVGVILYSTVTTQPMFLQTMLGYSAYDTGLCISPRGLASLIAMPLVGALVARIDTRRLIITGFCLFGAGSYELQNLNLEMSMSSVILPNILQGFGMACMFVPITVVAMSQLHQNVIGNATGIFNLSRNLGGSIGISLITTFLIRNGQVQQAQLAAHMTPYDPAFVMKFNQTARVMETYVGHANAPQRAYSALYGALVQQSMLVSFSNCFHVLSLVTIAAVALALLLKKAKPHGPMAAH